MSGQNDSPAARQSAPGLSLIVALDQNRVIGRDGGLPWHLPNDLKRFKALTMGKPIIMGRRTFESIGRPLPGRRNIVISNSTNFSAPGCDRYGSLELALLTIAPEVEAMVIGGAALYREALADAGRLYLTEIEASVAGDVHFPAISENEWREIFVQAHAADAGHAYAYRFRVLERIIRSQQPAARVR